jgi:hypothetical protein
VQAFGAKECQPQNRSPKYRVWNSARRSGKAAWARCIRRTSRRTSWPAHAAASPGQKETGKLERKAAPEGVKKLRQPTTVSTDASVDRIAFGPDGKSLAVQARSWIDVNGNVSESIREICRHPGVRERENEK